MVTIEKENKQQKLIRKKKQPYIIKIGMATGFISIMDVHNIHPIELDNTHPKLSGSEIDILRLCQDEHG